MKKQIKICGVNDAKFAACAESLGADFIGLIFAANSPRQIDTAKARQIIDALSGRAKVVAVFTHSTVEEIDSVARSLDISIIQLHRKAIKEDIENLHRLGYTVWTLAGGEMGDAVLFDSSHGDGETVLKQLPGTTILAGGISSTNIHDALSSFADIIDVSSSLESAKGVKSIKKLQEFFSTLPQ